MRKHIRRLTNENNTLIQSTNQAVPTPVDGTQVNEVDPNSNQLEQILTEYQNLRQENDAIQDEMEKLKNELENQCREHVREMEEMRELLAEKTEECREREREVQDLRREVQELREVVMRGRGLSGKS